jgi:hypothetical protein
MQQFLKAKAAAWRDHKSTSARANNRAIAQDGRLTLERVADEVCAGLNSHHKVIEQRA